MYPNDPWSFSCSSIFKTQSVKKRIVFKNANECRQEIQTSYPWLYRSKKHYKLPTIGNQQLLRIIKYQGDTWNLSVEDFWVIQSSLWTLLGICWDPYWKNIIRIVSPMWFPRPWIAFWHSVIWSLILHFDPVICTMALTISTGKF